MNDKKEPYMPQIQANNPEAFKAIYDKVKTLPQVIIDQIAMAKICGVGIELTYKEQWIGDNVAGKFNILPPSQISDFGEYIGIYCKDFFFIIRDKNYEAKKNYYIVTEDPKW